MKYTMLGFLILLVIQINITHAEVAVFKHYGMNDGLDSTKIKTITEDKNGIIWVGTDTSLFTFNGVTFNKLDTSKIATALSIQSLFVSDNNTVVIGTKDNGVLIHQNHQLIQIKHQNLDKQSINAIAQGPDEYIWLATNDGLFQFSNKHTVHRIEDKALDAFNNQKINTIKRISDQYISISQKNLLYLYHVTDKTLDLIPLKGDAHIHDVHKDSTDKLWVGTSQGLLRYDLKKNLTLQAPALKQASRILAIKPHQDNLWIASIDGGLYRINIRTLETVQFTESPGISYSLSDKNIMAMHIGRDDTLWAGGFYNGLSTTHLNLLNFNYETNQERSLSCAKGPRIFSIETDIDQSLWLGSSDGLIHWKPEDNLCFLINYENEGINTPFAVYDTVVDEQRIWLASSIGLLSYDKQLKILNTHNQNLPQTSAFFVHRFNEDLLLGTSRGLYQYDDFSSSYQKVKAIDKQFDNISYSRYFAAGNDQLFLPTNHGLLYLNTAKQIQSFGAQSHLFSDKTIEAFGSNDAGELFISVRGNGLYHLDSKFQIIHHYLQEIRHQNILHILTSGDDLWMSTDSGIISLNARSKKVQFYASEAHDNYLALSKTSHKDPTGQLYFGGNSGLIHFYPEEIKTEHFAYPLILDTLYLMNKPVPVHESTETGFTLTRPINQANNLSFSHRDKVISFGFNQPNYITPRAITYRYKLSPVSSHWTPIAAQQPLLTFTNLKAGTYQLDIEAINLNSTSRKSIQFMVNNPPWLSWWAFMLYALVLLAVIYFYIRKKIATEKRINAYLTHQVKQQTSHISQQKKTVEDLMARKNEIFSNVSHEFRTPLTLILGPMEELQKKEKDAEKKHSFSMVTRNAKRLLDLVNQMLKLAQVSEIDSSQKELIELSSRLNMVIEPYSYLAKLNNIKLHIQNIDHVKLMLTEDALETIVTNFLSNAIKYTEAGGEISVGTRLTAQHVEVYVKDNGPGIKKADQEKIFKRFERIQHGSIQGVGIGLALVKELATLNQAELMLNSEHGKGSEFIVKFPVDLSLQTQNQSNVPVTLDQTKHLTPAILNNRQTVLIIDDNEEMRLYIEQILSRHFICLLANGGTDGIAKALKHVPDIVICDVMMPVIDGFQVCRQLRSETITSHIPLVLLTALDEKASRIKGWRENIDRYLNKPFDAQELVLQLKNILNTRQLLMNNQLHDPASKQQPYYSKVDQDFIDKFKQVIADGYADPLFNLEQMASLMMVSDRQLQRKIKALMDRSPMELVREFRLKNAAQLLTKGKQIAYVSDVCGFSNASHFSYSFKKNYGMTPKAYQKLNHSP